jgi:PKD repeat protein
VRARDAIWAVTTLLLVSASCSKRVEIVEEPKISFVNASPVAAAVGAPVRLTCSATTEKTGVVSYRWSVSANGGASENLEGIAVDFTATKPGQYVATCTASNARGSDLKTASFIVETDNGAGSRAAGELPKSPIAVKVSCDKPRVHGGDETLCEATAAGASTEPTFTFRTSFGSIQGSGPKVTLQTPKEARRGGQETADIEVEARTATGVGTAKTSVVVDVVACAKASLEAAPTIGFAHVKPTTFAELVDRVRDGGAIAIDATQPPSASLGLAACNGQLLACATETHQPDACVKSVSRCTSAKPWLGDPNGVDCCPTSCIEAYFKARSERCADDIFPTFTANGCYPTDAPPKAP